MKIAPALGRIGGAGKARAAYVRRPRGTDGRGEPISRDKCRNSQDENCSRCEAAPRSQKKPPPTRWQDRQHGPAMGIEVDLVEFPKFLAAGERDGWQASKKEKRAASTRSRPRKRAAVRVEPERDMPGTTAPPCAICR